MKLLSFKNFVNEAIKLSDFRHYHKSAKMRINEYLHKRYARIFQSHKSDSPYNTKYRMFFPFTKSEGTAIKPIPEIVELLTLAGYTIDDYYLGKVSKGKETTSIGKVLGKLEKSTALNKTLRTDDPQVVDKAKSIIEKHKGGTPLEHQYRDQMNAYGKKADTKEEYTVVISRHFYDMMGQSENRQWMHDSCKRITGGSNEHYIPAEYGEGWLVAYLVKTKDIEATKNYKASDYFGKIEKGEYDFTRHHRDRIDPLKNPVARVLVIPYQCVEDRKKIRLFVSKEQVYGSNVPGFTDRLDEILDESGLRKSSEVFGTYSCDYSDGYTSYAIEINKEHNMPPSQFKKFLESFNYPDTVSVEFESEAATYTLSGDKFLKPYSYKYFNCSPANMQHIIDLRGLTELHDELYYNMMKEFRTFCFRNKIDAIDITKGEVKNEILEKYLLEFFHEFSEDITYVANSFIDSYSNELEPNSDFTKLTIQVPYKHVGKQNKWIRLVNAIAKGSEDYFAYCSMRNPHTTFQLFNMLEDYDGEKVVKWWKDRVGEIEGKQGDVDIASLARMYKYIICLSKEEFNEANKMLKDDGYEWDSGDESWRRNWYGVGLNLQNDGKRLSYYSIDDEEEFEEMKERYTHIMFSQIHTVDPVVYTVNVRRLADKYKYIVVTMEQYDAAMKMLRASGYDWETDISGNFRPVFDRSNGEIGLNISDYPSLSYSSELYRNQPDRCIKFNDIKFADTNSPRLKVGQGWYVENKAEFVEFLHAAEKQGLTWGATFAPTGMSGLYETNDYTHDQGLVLYIKQGGQIGFDTARDVNAAERNMRGHFPTFNFYVWSENQ